MDETLFTILKYVIAILTIVVFRYIIPWVKLKINNTKDNNLVNFIAKAINAAESIFNFIDKSGEQKKEYVIENVLEYVSQHNINITSAQINILVEGIFTELDSVTINTHKK